MNNGLYERDGASATARHAAWANWFEDPTMNVSNVYRGLRPPDEVGVTGRSASSGTIEDSGVLLPGANARVPGSVVRGSGAGVGGAMRASASGVPLATKFTNASVRRTSA